MVKEVVQFIGPVFSSAQLAHMCCPLLGLASHTWLWEREQTFPGRPLRRKAVVEVTSWPHKSPLSGSGSCATKRKLLP